MLMNDTLEVLYGGAAGGGKSVGALQLASQFVDVPGYSALLLRKSYQDLALPNALMDLSHQWWNSTDAHWDGANKEWTFPSGAKVTFGYLEKANDHLRYQSSSYSLCCFDELTQFPMQHYLYLFSRLRRSFDLNVPIRMRAFCVDYGEVLTVDGWKPIQDVQIGEWVYSVSPDGVLEPKPVIDRYAGPSGGSLVRVNKTTLTMSMTPDHRVVRSRAFENKRTAANEVVRWNEDTNRYFSVLRAIGGYFAEGLTDADSPVEGWAINDYLAFLGIYLADGSRKSRQACKKGKGHSVLITQVNTTYHERIIALLNRLTRTRQVGHIQQLPSGNYCVRKRLDGKTYCETFTTLAEAESVIYHEEVPLRWCHSRNGDFQITNKAIWEHFDQFGYSGERFVPRKILQQASRGQLQILFDWLMMGDGSTKGNSYHTTSRQLADDVAEIALKLGYKVHVTYQVLSNPKHANRYTVLLSRAVHTSIDKTQDVCEVPYFGEVYCITVADYGTFLLRQNGTVWASGNTNPGGPGHEWVKTRFNLPRGPSLEHPQRKFLPSTLDDNPFLDAVEYDKSLVELSATTRAQLRGGDWTAVAQGGRFSPDKFHVIGWDDLPPPSEFSSVVRFWDLAGSAPNDEEPNPDWSVGIKVGMTRHGKMDYDLPDFYVMDISRFRKGPGETEQEFKRVARRDGTGIPQWVEQEKGGAGKLLIGSYAAGLPGHMVFPLNVQGDKETRAKLPANLVEEGRFYIVDEPFTEFFFDELGMFPTGDHDDQVDALSGSVIALPRSLSMMNQGRVIQR